MYSMILTCRLAENKRRYYGDIEVFFISPTPFTPISKTTLKPSDFRCFISNLGVYLYPDNIMDPSDLPDKALILMRTTDPQKKDTLNIFIPIILKRYSNYIRYETIYDYPAEESGYTCKIAYKAKNEDMKPLLKILIFTKDLNTPDVYAKCQEVISSENIVKLHKYHRLSKAEISLLVGK